MSRDGPWQCDACGAGFASITAFDMHRIGAYASGKKPSARRCLSASEMRAKGMQVTQRGWTTGREFIRATGAA